MDFSLDAMAFPIPSHLPRRAPAQDVSSKVLNKIDEVTNKALNSQVAASWMKELDEEIHGAKERLHKRIQDDPSEFERQLATSKSVQSRLQSLSTNISALTNSVLDSKDGHIPKLVTNVSAHKDLAQKSQDASTTLNALEYLLRCRNLLSTLERLISDGNLDAAKGTSVDLSALLQQTPPYLKKAKVVADIQRRFMAAQARNEEQLSEAFTRGVVITHTELVIFPSVQVRQSAATIQLHSILSSLSPGSLSNHLTTLRRDLISHFIDHLFKQPASISHDSTGFIEHRLSHIPAPPTDNNPILQIENVASVLSFLGAYVFDVLPPEEKTAFPRTLVKPTSTSLLNNLLIPSLPKSFDGLPAFLEVTREAVKFEESSIIGLLGADAQDRPIRTWVDGLAGHYERQRRKLILENSRSIIASTSIGNTTFLVDVELSTITSADVVPVQEDEPAAAPNVVEPSPEPSPFKEDAWGFEDEDQDGTTAAEEAVEEDGWGFDEDVPMSPKTPQNTSFATNDAEHSPKTNSTSSPEIINQEPEPEQEDDAADAWGWNEDEDPPPEEETAWDDPWDEKPAPPPPPVPVVASPPPKIATRLEKVANKGKKAVNGSVIASETSSPASSFHTPITSPEITLPSVSKKEPAQSPISVVAGKRPAQLVTTKLIEHYAVSERMKHVVSLVEDILDEGKKFSSSNILTSQTSSNTGSVIILTAPSVVDLYRALWPVVNIKQLEAVDAGFMFSNDCTYLADEVKRIAQHLPAHDDSIAKVKEKLEESEKSVRVLAESWWHNVIKTQKESIHRLLEEGGQGFAYSGDQDRYDECEAAINKVLQQIRRSSPKLKKILTKSKYYTAIGLFVDAALNKMLSDVLALPDIPELESHRLSELCRIFNALEGLFVENPEEPSFVVAYVPSWLKFSYLSELLEATMADITYLFETGALVDFSIDELVRLVKALFSDNPRRADTINKLMAGHPTQS